MGERESDRKRWREERVDEREGEGRERERERKREGEREACRRERERKRGNFFRRVRESEREILSFL